MTTWNIGTRLIKYYSLFPPQADPPMVDTIHFSLCFILRPAESLIEFFCSYADYSWSSVRANVRQVSFEQVVD